MKNVIIGAASIAMFAGCASGNVIKPDSVNLIRNKSYMNKPKDVQDQRIITDSYLAKKLKLTSVRESVMKNGLKKFQVGMRNTRTGALATEEPYQIVYKFAWFDIDGIEVSIEDEDGWRKKYIIPGDIVWINSVAPNKKCHDFVLRLKTIR